MPVVRLLIAALLPAVALSGCGSDESTTLDGPVRVSIEHGEVTPVGRVVRVERDQQVTLDVTADAAAELHLHTAGDGQEFEVTPGHHRYTFRIATPGTYEMEEHHTGAVVLKVEVE